MDYFGSIAGATLGYIHGNWKSARTWGKMGYEFGRKRKLGTSTAPSTELSFPKKKQRTMAPVRRGSNPMLVDEGPRRVLYTPRTPRTRALFLRRSNMKRVGGRGRSRRSGRTRFKRYSHKTVLRRKNQRRAKKKVYVSRKLRQKIKKVVNENKIKGLHQETSYDSIRMLASGDNVQQVNEISNVPNLPWFSPIRVLDAASAIWNEKIMSLIGKNLIDLNNFDPKKLKVIVKDSNVTINFRNNTQRTITLRLVSGMPKSRTDTTLINAWTQALIQQNLGQGPNQGNINPFVIHTNPGMLPNVRKQFKLATSKIVLEPGAEYCHFVQGPKDQLYDFVKFWDENNFRNNQNFSKYILALTYVDQVGTLGASGTGVDGQQGRYIDEVGDGAAHRLNYEIISRYTMAMPELTGFIQDIGPGPVVQQLNQRQFSYAITSYTSVQVGEATRIDKEQPGTDIQAPD